MVMAIADSDDFQLFSIFCFKFPPAVAGEWLPQNKKDSHLMVHDGSLVNTAASFIFSGVLGCFFRWDLWIGKDN